MNTNKNQQNSNTTSQPNNKNAQQVQPSSTTQQQTNDNQQQQAPISQQNTTQQQPSQNQNNQSSLNQNQQQVNPPTNSNANNKNQVQQQTGDNKQNAQQQQQQSINPSNANGQASTVNQDQNQGQQQQQQNGQNQTTQKILSPEEIKQKEMEDQYQEILNKKIQQLEEAETTDQPKNVKLGPPITINAKCHIKGHQDDIMGICLKPNCEKKSRLVCFTCAISNHSDHAQYIVRLTDMRQEALFIRNWPTDKLALDVKEFLQLNSTKDIIKSVDQIFEKFQKEFVRVFEKVKEQVKKDISEKLQKYDGKIKELELQLNETYNLQAIKNNINEFNNQKLKQPEFESKIHIWLTGNNSQILKRELEEHFWEKKKQIKQLFSSILLQSFFDKLLKILDDIPKSIWPKGL